jgi:hypothetical protein
MQNPEAAPAAGALRYLEGHRAESAAAERAWIALFGALAFAAGHGVFLLAALTRLRKIPALVELGSGFLELAVLAWFAAAVPLSGIAVLLRQRIRGLPARRAWTLAFGALLPTLAAFALYLHAVALARP